MPTASWSNYADTYAFIGNSLLKPMSQTEVVGLDPAFWDAFPNFGDARVTSAVQACKVFAENAQVRILADCNVVEEVSVEYTKLFIGPPSPAAPPWETMNCADGASVGFGKPTFEMQDVLRDMGLQVSNENNQYADHIGIELLALSEMCRRANAHDGKMPADKIVSFIDEHPAAWIETLHSKVHEAFPESYYDNLLELAFSVLLALKTDLSR